MIVPLISPDGDAVAAGQTVLRAGADELFSLLAEKLHKVNRAGPELLFLCEIDVGHTITSFKLRTLLF